ncbi:hypothetical protein K3495_g5506 [Podosphaera aphanis]|nr:hypothetical protein K3495_g5506 [Podosphaera aphanis]
MILRFVTALSIFVRVLSALLFSVDDHRPYLMKRTPHTRCDSKFSIEIEPYQQVMTFEATNRSHHSFYLIANPIKCVHAYASSEKQELPAADIVISAATDKPMLCNQTNSPVFSDASLSLQSSHQTPGDSATDEDVIIHSPAVLENNTCLCDNSKSNWKKSLGVTHSADIFCLFDSPGLIDPVRSTAATGTGAVVGIYPSDSSAISRNAIDHQPTTTAPLPNSTSKAQSFDITNSPCFLSDAGIVFLAEKKVENSKAVESVEISVDPSSTGSPTHLVSKVGSGSASTSQVFTSMGISLIGVSLGFVFWL